MEILLSDKENAIAKAKLVVEFYKANGRLPIGNAFEPEEKKIANWLDNYRTAILNNKTVSIYAHYPEVDKILDDDIGMLFIDRRQFTCLAKAKQYVAMVNGTLENATDDEKAKLLTWFDCYKSKYVRGVSHYESVTNYLKQALGEDCLKNRTGTTVQLDLS